MKKCLTTLKNKYIFILSLLLFSLPIPFLVFSQGARHMDEAVLEVELAARVETMLEKLIGKERSLVKVNITLSRPLSGEKGASVGSLRNIPGVAVSDKQPTEPSAVSSRVTIQRIAVLVYLDETLSEDKVNMVRQKVPELLELDFQRGDSLKVEQIPWKRVAPEDVSLVQVDFLKKNLLLILVVAATVVLAVLFFVINWLRVRKPLRKVLKRKAEEEAEPGGPTEATSLAEIKEILTKSAMMSPERLDSLLEEIKETLVQSPTKSDTLLEEIKETLANIAALQGRGGKGGEGAGKEEAPAPAAGGGQDFLQALRDTLAPLSGGAAAIGAGGKDTSPEVLEALTKIEETLKEGLTTKEEGEAIDEPFKFLNNLPSGKIALLIEGEPAKMAAVILAHINADKSAEVFRTLPLERQLEISAAMATLVEDEDVALQVKEFLKSKLSILRLYTDFKEVKGAKAIADILSTLPYNVTTTVLNNLGRENPQLVREIRQYLFLFEDIPQLSDKDVQEILKSVDIDRLIAALSVAPPVVREKFYKNMTERTAGMIRAELETRATEELSGEGGPKKIIIFEDIASVDNKTLEETFRNVDRDTLKIALKGTSEGVREKIYSMMTERGAAMLREDLEVMPSVSRERCDEAKREILGAIQKLQERPMRAQQEILEVIRQLEKAGRIVLTTREEEG